MSTYQIILTIITLVSVFLYLRFRWHESQHRFRTVVRFENLLECLEEMADEHRRGRHDWRKAIEHDLEWLEQNLNGYGGNMISQKRLDAVRDDLEAGNELQRQLKRPDVEDFKAVVMDPMNDDKSVEELYRLSQARKASRVGG